MKLAATIALLCGAGLTLCWAAVARGDDEGAGRILFTSDRSGNSEIYSMKPDGSGLVNLTTNPASDGTAAWLPDGTKIAFRSRRDGTSDLYVMKADGQHVHRLTNDPAIDLFPAWSPNGRRIAFDSSRTGTLEVYVMNADGSGVRQLTFTGPARAGSRVGRPTATGSPSSGRPARPSLNPSPSTRCTPTART